MPPCDQMCKHPVGDSAVFVVGRASVGMRQSGGGATQATVLDMTMERGTRHRKRG